MRNFCAFLISFFLTLLAFSNGVVSELRKIDPYLSSNPDTAIHLSKKLLEASTESSNYFGMVKANLYLGFLNEKSDPGKAVLYYLEGIRHAESAPLDSVKSDMIWLRRNLANIFRRYESNNLATEYNLQGLGLADLYGISHQIIDLKFNQALVYQNNEEYDLAISYLESILPEVDNVVFRSRIINQIGVNFRSKEDYETSSQYYNQLLSLPEEARHLSSRAHHNLGEIAYELGDRASAIEHLKSAISILNEIGAPEKHNYYLFIAYRNIGGYLLEGGETEQALSYLHEGEGIASYADHDPSSFELYKNLSSAYFNIGNNKLGNHYSQVYFEKAQGFIDLQKEIQQKDKEYNFELITKRYFDNVEKQDHMATIMMYSKISSGGLILLLILVISYYQMEKRRLRNSIEQELKTLKVLK